MHATKAHFRLTSKAKICSKAAEGLMKSTARLSGWIQTQQVLRATMAAAFSDPLSLCISTSKPLCLSIQVLAKVAYLTFKMVSGIPYSPCKF